jgi:HD-GYP domain-containing protein (c-di-GMP phosphodiesterase class II)
VTGPSTPRPSRASVATGMQSTEGLLRQTGRNFVVAFYTALRSLKLYPVENEQVQRALDELLASAKALFQIEDELEVRIAGDFIFVNSTRLRLDLDNYSSLGHVIGIFRQCGIGLMRVDPAVERREWQIFISLLLNLASREAAANKLYELQQRLTLGNVTHVAVEPPLEAEQDLDEQERAKQAARRTYERSVAVTKEVVSSVRMGRSASVKKIKRAVQTIVDQVLSNESSLIGLTTLRDYDEYTFTHSVNVCIFAVAIGRRLGLTKLQLYDLGMAALLHDIGKSRIPLEVLNKTGALSDEEWRIMQAHPWLGVLTLFGLRGYGEIPYRSMIVAYEHHMKADLSGYPKSLRPRQMSVFSKIVAVADSFDAATTRRAYQTTPIQPDQVLREMWTNPRRGLDPVLVKALINVLGIYPVGTCVLLDSYEIAVVHSANPDLTQLHRPVVRIAARPDGGLLPTGPLVNLAEQAPDGTYLRSIIKVLDPAKYGINPSDYLV